jgi:diguanylate cyclase (GGDEF)-like protein
LAFFVSITLSETAHANDSCQLKSLIDNTDTALLKSTRSAIKLKKGINQFELSCTLSKSGVLSFTRSGLEHFSWQQNGVLKEPIKTNQMAYLIEPGTFNAVLTVTASSGYFPRFIWQDTQHFIKKIQRYNLIFGLFYGLCITLIFYVLIIGFGIKDSIFKLYGAYIFCIGSFIFFQEGQPYLFTHNYFSSFITKLYILSIGLTVVSATWFMCAILELKRHWPRITTILKIASICVLTLCLERITLTSSLIANLGSVISGYLSLLIVISIFILSAVQSKKGVNEAHLVFIALSCVFISMTFRVLLIEYSPFLQRYGFVIAFTLESLLLAIAVSKRLQRLSYAKKQAERHANYDHLCHIYNRRGWSLKANELLQEHTLFGGILCFLYIDLDRFKIINDTYGHDVGDKVLCKVANLLNTNMRDKGVAGRLGGDEFVALALFNNGDRIEQYVTTFERKLNALVVEHQGATIAIKASVGRIDYTNAAKNLDDILQAGDHAMYQKKVLRKSQQQSHTNLPNS